MFQVEELEGRTVAVQNNSQFCEISVAENSPAIYSSIDMILNECRSVQTTQKTRKFSVSKMIGTLIGNANGKVVPNTNQGGTVVVCHKSDLYKSRVLKRRQNFTATASLWPAEAGELDGVVRWFPFTTNCPRVKKTPRCSCFRRKTPSERICFLSFMRTKCMTRRINAPFNLGVVCNN